MFSYFLKHLYIEFLILFAINFYRLKINFSRSQISNDHRINILIIKLIYASQLFIIDHFLNSHLLILFINHTHISLIELSIYFDYPQSIIHFFVNLTKLKNQYLSVF